MVTEEGGLPELLDALRSRWILIVSVAAFVFLGATFYVESLPAVYEGQSVVVLSPRADVTSASADTVRVLAPKYVAYVTAPATVADVASEVGLGATELQEAIDASVAADTGNVTITARLASPTVAADAANALANEAVRFSAQDNLLMGQVVARALPPPAPAGPPRRLLEGAALLLGVLLGVGVSFVAERGRPRLRSWRDMARLSGYPVLGRIPASRLMRTRPKEALADPAIGAAFRTLRTNLEREWQERTVDVILVTSASSGDGKTSVAALFAESLARLGGKTLLMDADLRRPGLSRSFKSSAGPGLADVLRGRAIVQEGVQTGWVDGLWVLPTTSDPDAGDLLAKGFLDVVREAREIYDVVVVDTPPLIGTDDARTLATLVSGVLLVISAGSPAATVHEALLSLETLKAPVLGVIANRVREPRSSYYYGA